MSESLRKQILALYAQVQSQDDGIKILSMGRKTVTVIRRQEYTNPSGTVFHFTKREALQWLREEAALQEALGAVRA